MDEDETNTFVIGGTPIKTFDADSEEARFFSDSPLENEDVNIEEQSGEETSEEVNAGNIPAEGEEIDEEDGEFGGYKLGNVYKKKSENIKDYENMKDVPIDILVTKGDPTRL